MHRLAPILLCSLAAVGCTNEELPVGIPLLGAGSHDLAMVQIDTIVSSQ